MKLRKIFTMLGMFALAMGIYVNSPLINRTYPLIESSISKSKEISERLRNHRPKRLLYLVSEDFKFDYKSINEDVRSKLNGMKKRYSKFGKLISYKNPGLWTYDGNVPSKEKVEHLERIIASFNLDEKDFMARLSGLNILNRDGKPYLVKEHSRDCEVILCCFKDQAEFFDSLLDENVNNLDGIIIGSHGYKGFLFPDEPVEVSEITKFFDPRNYISVRDILKLSPEKLRTIRSKFTGNAFGYLQACDVLKDSDKRTTIAEALTYLLGVPIVASRTVVFGVFADVHPYNSKVFPPRPETVTPENMFYMANYAKGDWVVVYPNINK